MKIWEVELQDPERILQNAVDVSEVVVAENYKEAAEKVLKQLGENEGSSKLFVSNVRKIAETTID